MTPPPLITTLLLNLLLLLSLAAGGVLSAPHPTPNTTTTCTDLPPPPPPPQHSLGPLPGLNLTYPSNATVHKPHCFNGQLPPTGGHSTTFAYALEALAFAESVDVGGTYVYNCTRDPRGKTHDGKPYNMCVGTGSAILGYTGTSREVEMQAVYEGGRRILQDCLWLHWLDGRLVKPFASVGGLVRVKSKLSGKEEEIFLRSVLP